MKFVSRQVVALVTHSVGVGKRWSLSSKRWKGTVYYACSSLASNVAAASAPSPDTSLMDSRTSRSTALIAESDTSKDELTLDEVTPVKRLRPSAASSVSYNSITERDSRATSKAPITISRVPLAPL